MNRGSSKLGASKKQRMSDINVVPYIDVMLVLLIIFMVTAPLISKLVDLPEAETAAIKDQDAKTLVITVDEVGKMYISSNENIHDSISAKELAARAGNTLGKNEKTVVLLRGHKEVDYEHIVKVSQILESAGAKSIGYVTVDPEAKR